MVGEEVACTHLQTSYYIHILLQFFSLFSFVEFISFNILIKILLKASLYSVRWYFQQEEFYRFVPKESPPSRVFTVAGITVDVSIHKHVRIFFWCWPAPSPIHIRTEPHRSSRVGGQNHTAPIPLMNLCCFSLFAVILIAHSNLQLNCLLKVF